MRVHEPVGPRTCDEVSGIGCKLDHQYNCRFCGGEFHTDESTFFSRVNYRLVSRWYPFCSKECASFASDGGDPMAVRAVLADRLVEEASGERI